MLNSIDDPAGADWALGRTWVLPMFDGIDSVRDRLAVLERSAIVAYPGQKRRKIDVR